jgi:DNA-binding transcriptional ArsR family regulator
MARCSPVENPVSRSTSIRTSPPSQGSTPADADVAAVASLLADPTRAAMVLALGDGRALSAGELARLAGVARSTASEHLARLVAGGLLRAERRGRHRWFRLTGPEVGELLEALAVVAPRRPAKDYRQASAGRTLERARTCYDHLAGWLGVAITTNLVERGGLVLSGRDYTVTPSGAALLRTLDVDTSALHARRRHFARACMDWSERRYHLAGALGAALADALFREGWIERMDGTRAVRVTNAGRRGLRRTFDVQVF